MRQGPVHVGVDVAGKSVLASRFQRPRDARQVDLVHEAALPVLLLWPRIRIELVGHVQRRSREPVKQFACIIIIKTDVLEAMRFDAGDRLDDAGAEWFAPDEADLRIFSGAVNEVLGTTEPDLQTNAFDWHGEQVRQVFRRRLCQVQCHCWQDLLKQLRLSRTCWLSDAAAEKGAFVVIYHRSHKYKLAGGCPGQLFIL